MDGRRAAAAMAMAVCGSRVGVAAPLDRPARRNPMLDADPSFRPLHRRDGYLALEDLGLIGDGSTAALGDGASLVVSAHR